MLNEITRIIKLKGVGGEIKWYGLAEWWIDEFTEEERNIVRNIYKPLGIDINTYTLDKGKCYGITQPLISFLGGLAPWFEKPEYYKIAKKIIKRAEKEYEETKDVLRKHYFCVNMIKVYYRNRDTEEGALDKAMFYCKEQIKLAPEVEPVFLHTISPYTLPTHTGYKQLAIIYEKEGKIKEALKLTEEAMNRGWNKEDCEKRIKRLKKKCCE